ncbi:hypothetical protein HID58_093648 [Brassica napus]|uniref:Uncharacterized protein n=1 Tax=Brassica napus TaxID=3708 RepID=A0ABQ7XA83_BRANA|nr:hypothetical protein HID58_093648 [Brassica napus]
MLGHLFRPMRLQPLPPKGLSGYQTSLSPIDSFCRFSPGREEDKAAGAFSYISFGGGSHGCLGEPFAYLQIKAIWSHLLRNFELELVSPFPEMDWNAMVVGIKGNVMVRYKRRQLVLD